MRPKGLGGSGYQDILLLVGEGEEERYDERDAMGKRWDWTWVLQGNRYERSLWDAGGGKGCLKNRKVLQVIFN